MKKKILLLAAITAILASIAALGLTSARYYSAASMTGEFGYVRTIGAISIYHPGWIGGYNEATGVFEVGYAGAEYENIHYAVTNEVDGVTNEKETPYYIRVVAADGSEKLPITYNVHGYNNNDESAVYDLAEGKGYGPFTLKAGSGEETCFSIKAANYDPQTKGLQNLQVQMVKEKASGGLEVIAGAPLNMQFWGCTVKLNYIDTSGNPMIDPAERYIRVGTTISSDDLDLPQSYELSEVKCDEYPGIVTDNSITIPDEEEYTCVTYKIDVVLNKTGEAIKVPVKFYNSGGAEVLSTEVAMDSDGTYTFTTDKCRSLCPVLNSMTSFTVYIANQWNSTYEVGNTHEDNSVVADYYATYTSWADFKLTDAGSYIYIKAWW